MGTFDFEELTWRRARTSIEAFRARVLAEGPSASEPAPVFDERIDGARTTRHLAARAGDELAALLRLHRVEAGSPLDAPKLASLPRGVAVLGVSGFIIAPEHRHSSLALEMFEGMYRRARSLSAHVVVAAVAPHLVMMYEALGFFRYGRGLAAAGLGFRVPMMLNTHDVAYMRLVGSALAPVAQRYQNPDPHGSAILAALGEIPAETRPPNRSQLAPALMTEDQRADLAPMLEAGLDHEALTRILGRSLHQELPAGAILIGAGQQSAALYVLVDGALGVVPDGRTQPVAYVQQGEAVGEMALLRGGRTRSASVVALSDSRVLALGQQDLEAITRADPVMGARLCLNLVAAMAERLARTTRLLLGDRETPREPDSRSRGVR